MIDNSQADAIKRVAEPILEATSAELVEMKLYQQGGQLVVRLLVDKVGGVTIQDCARLNYQIGQALEQANLIEQRYTLEVSSPGLDRPLVSKRDFERALGEELELDERGDSPTAVTRVKGRLLAVQHEAVVITTPAGNVTVPFERIQRARKALRW